MTAKRALSRVRAPDETGAEWRAWAVVRSAYRERSPATSRRISWRFAVLPALVVVVGAVALSPAGATIARWVKDTLGVPHAAKALFSLPAPGRVLVSGSGGTWIIATDGTARRLGAWPDASWSPHGLYIAAARSDQLAAVDPRGKIVWALARPAVAEPRWYPPSGYRIAYLAGGSLRVVAGDGTDDRRVATGVASVAPAWRPGPLIGPYQLAYATGAGRVVVRDASTGQTVWMARSGLKPEGKARKLVWSANGSRLLALTPTRALLYAQNGRLTATVAPGGPILDGSFSPDGRELALLIGGAVDRVEVGSVASGSPSLTPVFSGAGLRQLTWSPNGRWLLVSWPAADQWVFVRVAGRPRIAAVSHIAQQFAARASSVHGFPRLEGWCCQRWPTGR
jgi:hypothetical protein